jgi:hypothetical protein
MILNLSIWTEQSTQLSNDPSLSSLPLLTTFLKSYSRPYLSIIPPASSKQISSQSEPGTLSASQEQTNENTHFPALIKEEEELIEQEIRDRFRRMCEGYYENVCKKLLIEHKVRILFLSSNQCPFLYRDCKNKTSGIMKRTFAPARFSRTANKLMKR